MNHWLKLREQDLESQHLDYTSLYLDIQLQCLTDFVIPQSRFEKVCIKLFNIFASVSYLESDCLPNQLNTSHCK